jgi:uncharacterized protein
MKEVEMAESIRELSRVLFTKYYFFVPGVLFSFAYFELTSRHPPLFILFFFPTGSLLCAASYATGRSENPLGILFSLRTSFHFSVVLGFFIVAGVLGLCWIAPLTIATENSSPVRMAGVILYLLFVIAALARIWPAFADPFIHKSKIDWEETWEDEYTPKVPGLGLAWKMTALPGSFLYSTVPVFVCWAAILLLLIGSYGEGIDLGIAGIVAKLNLYFILLPMCALLMVEHTAMMRKNVFATQNEKDDPAKSKKRNMPGSQNPDKTSPEFAQNKLRARVEYFLSKPDAAQSGGSAWRTLVSESARLGQTDLLARLIDPWKASLKQISKDAVDTNALYDHVRASSEKVCENLDAFSLFQDGEMSGNLLGTAAQECKIDTLRVLMALGYDLTAQNMYSDTALHTASMTGCVEAIDILVAGGVDPNTQNKDGKTPLMYAVELGKSKAVDALIAHGADPQIQTKYGDTALTMTDSALLKDDADIVNKLMGAGAKPDHSTDYGKTPLMAAAKWGRVEIVKTLLDEGVAINAADTAGRTALMESVGLAKDTKVISLLAARGADINAVDKDGNTALTLAVASDQNNVGVVGGILELGADANVKNSKGMTALEIAASLGRTEMVARIDSAGAKGLESLRIAKLVAAIEEGDVSRVKTTLGSLSAEMLCAALGTRTRQNSVLRKAAYYGMVDVVELLLDGGVDIDGFDGDRNTALNFAARGNRISVAKLLLQRGCDVNLPTDRNYTPLDFTSMDEMIQLLRAHGGKSIEDG